MGCIAFAIQPMFFERFLLKPVLESSRLRLLFNVGLIWFAVSVIVHDAA